MIQGKEDALLGWLGGNAAPWGHFGVVEVVESHWIWELFVGRAWRPVAPEGENPDTGTQNVTKCH